ncbi:MAG: hypothetical protein GY796_19115 [Chloroflexi bacterium]|nr:hypothetical protein [Chloroflexota bacterium]
MIDNKDEVTQMEKQANTPFFQGCPYFGIEDDPDTNLMFPAPGGFCHRAKPSDAVEITYQQTTCLTQQYRECPVFLSYREGPLPPEISGVEIRHGRSRRVLAGILIILLFATVGTVLGLWMADSNQNLSALIPTNSEPGESDLPTQATVAILPVPSKEIPMEEPTPIPATATDIAPEPTAVPTLTATPPDTPTPPLPATFTPQPPTNTPAPTATAVPDALAEVAVDKLNVRFGPSLDFTLLGLAEAGEQYAIIGRTSDDAWLQICCLAESPGWVFAETMTVTGNLDIIPIITEFPES